VDHGSLFSGIGGFDLASEWMGWENKFHCEWSTFGQTILKYYWKNAISYGDITKTDFTIWRGKIDILTGGFPCQPYSVAGKQEGKDDERHLWPEMLRAIREIRPRWVVGENVRGLVSWNGGLVFEEVQTDLEAEGYEVQPFILPAAAVDAPHRRDRVWFIAYSNHSGESGRTRKDESKSEEKRLQEWDEIQQSNQSNSLREFSSKSSCERCNNRGNNREERQVQNNENRNAQEDESEWCRRECGTCKIGKDGNASNSCITRREKLHVSKKSNKSGFCSRCNNESNDASDPSSFRSGKSKQSGSSKQFDEDVKERGVAANTKSKRTRELQDESEEKRSRFSNVFFREQFTIPDWENFPTQSPICNGDDGISSKLDFATVFKGIGNPRKPITFSKWRNESIKGGGNAIVPQVAYQIFKAIQQYDNSNL